MLERTQDGWIPKCELCNWQGEVKPEQGPAQQVYMNHCRTLEHRQKKGKDEEPPLSTSKHSLEGLSDEEIPLYYGEEGIKLLRRRKLEAFLDKAPQVSERVRDWILSNYESDERAQGDPNALFSLLIESKLPEAFAHRIVTNLMQIEQKHRTPQQFYTPMYSRGSQQMYPQNYGYNPFGYPVNERYEKLEKELEELREDKKREELEKKEREREEKWSKEITELKETLKSRAQGDTMIVTVPLRDAAGNIIMSPDGKAVQQMLQGPPSHIQALLAQQGEKMTPERIQMLVGSEIDKRINTGGISREDMERILDEREEKKAWKDTALKLEELKKDIEKSKDKVTITGGSEASTIELKKLDLVGEKLDDIHDTVKEGMKVFLTPPPQKPKERSLEDITKLDEELSTIAKEAEKPAER